ncbi:alpha-galactosidase [Deinococcus cellulosilyticus]|uniref:Alpha-glucosidase/alpha-galactosidase n=1 Tax=Deinococcus cellulosilyticus (strain DSM 18568 / NBRC 106333 / KACC 11606 / 5516J-15) TaxID=1223518 RepID=A0A511N8G1_DEIC1|nr:alpha-galactosidase [Deinococcus cellulosilyticus]GEM49114.1 alpha-glucosidase/alpha-galactosidase [Deinococcus cellulosilyticus NBRC 106333 = KACC 11606]
MVKIAIIGAGGHAFPLRLVADILSFPALQNSTLALMDINPERLSVTARHVQKLISHHRLPTQVQVTTDQRAALRDANYVIITFQVGGLEAYRHDVEIPRKYGIDQTVGDTLGPGGVMRFLRSAPAYKSIAQDMLELCPEAQLINYANPMAMATWYLSSLGVKAVGLCHSVQGTTHMLAREVGVPYSELVFKSAGINHQAWLLSLTHQGKDLYPQIRQVMRDRYLGRQQVGPLPTDDGNHSQLLEEGNVYEGGQEQVRTSIMEHFGYFHTESSHHASEYLPYFRKNQDLSRSFITHRWDYYQICCEAAHDDQSGFLEELLLELKPSIEYGATIIHSMETGTPSVIYGNVINTGLIENLPEGCCVEVACLVDRSGVQPTHLGKLPPQLAAVNRTSINVQELAVLAALEENLDHVYHAIALDPLSSALLTLNELRQMTRELLEAEQAWLPEFCQLRTPATV